MAKTVISTLILVLLFVSVTASLASSTSNDQPNVDLDLRDVSIRSALEMLFTSAGKNFSIQGDVSGNIASLSISNVPFDVALATIEKSHGLVHSLNGDTYIIKKRPEPKIFDEVTPPEPPVVDMQVTSKETKIEKIQLMHTDPREIMAIIGNKGTPDIGLSPFAGNSGQTYGSWGSGGYQGITGNYPVSSYYGSGSNPGMNRPNYGSPYSTYNSGYMNNNYGYNSYGGSYSQGHSGYIPKFQRHTIIR